jgi:hypothetical protein
MAHEGHPDASPEHGLDRTAKRPYMTPKLIEYGSVAKLTRGTKSVQADNTGGGFQKKTCL